MERMIKQFIWQHFCELIIVNYLCKAYRKAQGDSEVLGQINLFKQMEDNHMVGSTIDKKLVL